MACKNFIDFLHQRCIFIYLLFIFRTKQQHHQKSKTQIHEGSGGFDPRGELFPDFPLRWKNDGATELLQPFLIALFTDAETFQTPPGNFVFGRVIFSAGPPGF